MFFKNIYFTFKPPNKTAFYFQFHYVGVFDVYIWGMLMHKYTVEHIKTKLGKNIWRIVALKIKL